MKIQSAIFTIPKMETKNVFIGAYGGHYDVVVIFSEKPAVSKEEHNIIRGEWVDCLDNQKLIIGCSSLCDFREQFPTLNLSAILENDRPKEIEVSNVIEAKITACFDEYGKMKCFDFGLDGWVK